MAEIINIIVEFFTRIWNFVKKAGIFKGWPLAVAAIAFYLFPGKFWAGFGDFLLGGAAVLAWVQFREEILAWWKK